MVWIMYSHTKTIRGGGKIMNSCLGKSLRNSLALEKKSFNILYDSLKSSLDDYMDFSLYIYADDFLCPPLIDSLVLMLAMNLQIILTNILQEDLK